MFIQEALCGIVASLFYMSFSAKWYVDVTHVNQTLFYLYLIRLANKSVLHVIYLLTKVD